jgi:hypothetical protein
MAKQTDGIDTMRKRYQMASDHVKDAYDMCRDDVRFVAVPGNQWDQKLRTRRGERPTYEFPKLNSSVRQVINEMRQNRPSGKVRGAEEGDRALAELMQGLCRNIESVSNADQAYDIAYEFAVQGAMAYGVSVRTTPSQMTLTLISSSSRCATRSALNSIQQPSRLTGGILTGPLSRN